MCTTLVFKLHEITADPGSQQKPSLQKYEYGLDDRADFPKEFSMVTVYSAVSQEELQTKPHLKC
jgi:hypothetical protein